MVATSEALAAGWISDQWKREVNRKQTESDWWEQYLAATFTDGDEKQKSRLEKSVRWTAESAVDWLTNVEFSCIPTPLFCGADKPQPTCMSELSTCMWSTAELAATTAWHGNTSAPGAQSGMHCSGLTAVSGWCQSVSQKTSDIQHPAPLYLQLPDQQRILTWGRLCDTQPKCSIVTAVVTADATVCLR